MPLPERRGYLVLDPTKPYPIGVILEAHPQHEELWVGGFESTSQAEEWATTMRKRYEDYTGHRVVKVETPEIAT